MTKHLDKMDARDGNRVVAVQSCLANTVAWPGAVIAPYIARGRLVRISSYLVVSSIQHAFS